MKDERLFCEFLECDKPVFRRRRCAKAPLALCQGHMKQLQRAGGDHRQLRPLMGPVTPEDRFTQAVLAYADVETDAVGDSLFPQRQRDLNDAMRRLFLSRGWKPPAEAPTSVARSTQVIETLGRQLVELAQLRARAAFVREGVTRAATRARALIDLTAAAETAEGCR